MSLVSDRRSRRAGLVSGPALIVLVPLILRGFAGLADGRRCGLALIVLVRLTRCA